MNILGMWKVVWAYHGAIRRQLHQNQFLNPRLITMIVPQGVIPTDFSEYKNAVLLALDFNLSSHRVMSPMRDGKATRDPYYWVLHEDDERLVCRLNQNLVPSLIFAVFEEIDP